MIVKEEDGRILFHVYEPRAGNVELMGDFTRWSNGALPMHRTTEGWWDAELAVPAGDHEFVYVVNGASILPDYAANGVKWNGVGRLVSLLTVP